MGTEESLFTILSYKNKELYKIEPINANGLIVNYLTRVKDAPSRSKRPMAIYSLTFNCPEQWKSWVESVKVSLPEEFENAKKYVVNNSTDKNLEIEYKKLFEANGFEEIKFNNIGICRGRQYVAEHFDKSDHDYMLFFEDDMLMHPPNASGVCKSGFKKGVAGLIEKSIGIMEYEDLDYLKLSFSEVFGDNFVDWAFYNVPESKRKLYYSETNKTKIKYLSIYKDLPYAVGYFHYSNWPLLFNKRGNKRVFLDTVWKSPYEQTWTSHVRTLMEEGKVKAGCLLASPINHRRIKHYGVQNRKEN